MSRWSASLKTRLLHELKGFVLLVSGEVCHDCAYLLVCICTSLLGNEASHVVLGRSELPSAMCARLMAGLMADETLLVLEVFQALFLHKSNGINIHGVQIFDGGDSWWRCIVRGIGVSALIGDGLCAAILTV